MAAFVGQHPLVNKHRFRRLSLFVYWFDNFTFFALPRLEYVVCLRALCAVLVLFISRIYDRVPFSDVAFCIFNLFSCLVLMHHGFPSYVWAFYSFSGCVTVASQIPSVLVCKVTHDDLLVAQKDAYMGLRENVKLSGSLESLEYVRYCPAGDHPYIS